MESLVNKILKILKEHVRQNNLEIGLNQEDINRIISELDSTAKENNDLEYKRSLNSELLHENDDFINMQLQLSEFMEKYGHLITDSDAQEQSQTKETVMPYFDQTIEGQMEFGPDHPQFYNPRFFNELMRYYQEQEDYEKCDQLVKIKRGDNKF